mgnify:CR=1 FL=1
MKIKILIILLGLLLLIFMSPKKVQGQIAVKGGAALSGFQPWQDLSPFSGHDYRPFLGYEVDWLQHDDTAAPSFGLQFGVSYTRRLSKHFAVQPELFYSQRGVYFYQTELYNTSYKLSADFIEIPVLFKYEIPLKLPFKPGLLLGPYAAFKLDADRTLDIWGEKETKNLSCVKNFDYGLVFAINSEFSAWRPMMLEMRLNFGLANTMEQPEEFTEIFEDAGKVTVLAFTLMTGFRF